MEQNPPNFERLYPRQRSRVVDSEVIDRAVHSSRIGGLDFLRAIAVSLVIVGHALDGRYSNLPPLGGVGVTIFFVLSGFLISRLLLDEYEASQRIHFTEFYRRRVARLMPAFYLFLVIGLLALSLRHQPIPTGAVVSSIFYYTNYYQAFTGAQTNLVSHCWSLAVEEQFYVLWPMFAALLLRRRFDLVRALTIVILAVWCWRWYLVSETSISFHYLYRALDTRADDLAIGCLLTVLVRRAPWRLRFATLLRTRGLGLILIAGICFFGIAEGRSDAIKYGISFVVEPLLIALLVLATVVASNQSTLLARLINCRLCVHIGKISYGMYLFHGLLGFTAERLAERFTGSFTFALIVEYIVIAVFCSVIFRWFETPIRRWIVGVRTPPVALVPLSST